jgi:putative membrane protein
MTLDALLAITHHIAIFGLFATLAIEWGILRPDLTAGDLARLRRYDLAYGVAAGAVVVAGVSRVVLASTSESFYLDNPVFWLKMATFGAVGLLSIVPTVRYLGWSRRERIPDSAEVAGARRFVGIELALFALIPVFAALMARGIGL